MGSRLGSSRSRPGRHDARRRRTLDARPDTLDFRDRMFVPTLVEVPVRVDLADYLGVGVPVLDQGQEGACTGFGLATVAHYLMRRRRVVPDATPVSPWMLYDMARRYDEWPGEDYEGSSARGAMKGWHKHGVCAARHWPRPKTRASRRRTADIDRWADAARRPLGAYFRVNHRDLVAMHAAIAEVGILFATATVHAGWDEVRPDGVIRPSDDLQGGHAFAIVAYDERGFWIQNSWGRSWGRGGLGHVSYDDWLANGTDVWAARLGAPVIVVEAGAAARGVTASVQGSRSYAYADLRPHIISVGNDGRLRVGGTFGTSASDVAEILQGEFDRITRSWPTKRLLLYAHGGLTSEEAAVQRVADYRQHLLDAGIYPVAFVWKTDVWSTIDSILEDALGRRTSEGVLDAAKDFMLDRLDDALEPLTRALGGLTLWSEMKENALGATRSVGGAMRTVLPHVARLASRNVEIHVVAHSAGAIVLGPAVHRLSTRGRGGLDTPVSTCTLWAPACTIALARECYLPAVVSKRIGRLALFTLTDKAERDDHCGRIYRKSLLYLVSNALEARLRAPVFGRPDGEPILGMAKFLERGRDLLRLPNVEWVTAPNDEPPGSAVASGATAHGAFDEDTATLHATMARILRRRSTAAPPFDFQRSAASRRHLRQQLAG